MPAYTVEIGHLETDQVFTTYHVGKMLSFNVGLLARLHKQMRPEFDKITMDLDQPYYDMCMNHRGIEEPRVARLTPRQLREPGYAVTFEDGLFTVVDGHHRLVRRYRGGVRVMDFWVAPPDIWRHCLVECTPEAQAELARAVPPRVDNPGLLASPVKVH